MERLGRGGPPSPAEVEENVLALRGVAAEVTPGDFVVEMVPADPKDNPVIAAALEAGAEYIVTDDRKLNAIKVVRVAGYRPVQIVTASAFLRLLGRR